MSIAYFHGTQNKSISFNYHIWIKLFHAYLLILLMVGKMGFEPTTSRSRSERTTKLCYFPIRNQIMTAGRFRLSCLKHPYPLNLGRLWM